MQSRSPSLRSSGRILGKEREARSGIIRFREESDWPLKWMRSSILAKIPGFRQQIILEPRVPSRGSQARGTRLGGGGGSSQTPINGSHLRFSTRLSQNISYGPDLLPYDVYLLVKPCLYMLVAACSDTDLPTGTSPGHPQNRPPPPPPQLRILKRGPAFPLLLCSSVTEEHGALKHILCQGPFSTIFGPLLKKIFRRPPPPPSPKKFSINVPFWESKDFSGNTTIFPKDEKKFSETPTMFIATVDVYLL